MRAPVDPGTEVELLRLGSKIIASISRRCCSIVSRACRRLYVCKLGERSAAEESFSSLSEPKLERRTHPLLDAVRQTSGLWRPEIRRPPEPTRNCLLFAFLAAISRSVALPLQGPTAAQVPRVRDPARTNSTLSARLASASWTWKAL